MCSEKVSFGSRVRPSIIGKGFVARILLLMLRLRDLEYSAGSGVKRFLFLFYCLYLINSYLRLRILFKSFSV